MVFGVLRPSQQLRLYQGEQGGGRVRRRAKEERGGQGGKGMKGRA